MSGEFLTLSLAANETKHFVKAGRYFEITDSQYPVNLQFFGHSGALSSNVNNCLSGLYLEDAWGTFSIQNSGIAQTVTVLLMDTGRGGSRRQPGNVNVIDNSASKVMADSIFAGTYSATASGTAGSVVILGALGGSGKRIALKSLMVSSAIAGRCAVYFGSSGGTLTPAGGFHSKYVQAASNTLAGQGRANAFNCAAASPSGTEVSGITGFFNPYVAANTPTQCIQGGAPIVLETGRLLVVSAEALNRDISAWFEFEEF